MYLEDHKRTQEFFWKGVGEKLIKVKINILRMTHKSFSFQNQVIFHPCSSHPGKKLSKEE